MTIPLLQTKLYIPLPRTELVPHSHLIKRLNEGLHRTPGVTLISAPAGFGKTIGFTDRSYQKAKRRMTNDELSEVLAPHSSFRGDKI
jgi:ATP/maltotriose-dependent transcriptional regulator MalT